jgi:hypothetical protein
VTTPASTLESSPQETILDVSCGLIYNVKFYFPPGSCGLLHMRVFDCSHQIWPNNLDGSLIGDNFTYDFDELYEKTEPPFVFIIKTWNEDDTYEHKVIITLGMVTVEAYKARFLPQQSNADMAEMIASLSTVQQKQKIEAAKAFAEKYRKKQRTDE